MSSCRSGLATDTNTSIACAEAEVGASIVASVSVAIMAATVAIVLAVMAVA